MNKSSTFALLVAIVSLSVLAAPPRDGRDAPPPGPPPNDMRGTPPPHEEHGKPNKHGKGDGHNKKPSKEKRQPVQDQAPWRVQVPEGSWGGEPSRPHGRPEVSRTMRLAGEFNAGGASEVRFGESRVCSIQVISGSITINTVVVRRGAAKESVVVAGRFDAGQSHVISLGQGATGLRISTGGKGRYRIYVQ